MDFLRYGNANTPEPTYVRNAMEQLTPALCFGHPSICSVDNYDKFDSETLKHFKLTVAAPSNAPLIRMDSYDLLVGCNHTILPPNQQENILCNAVEDHVIYSEAKGLPLKFQKVHFNVSSNASGPTFSKIKEATAYVLISDPVLAKPRSDSDSGTPPCYEGDDAGETLKSPSSDIEENSPDFTSVSKWNDESWIESGDSQSKENYINGKITIGPTLHDYVNDHGTSLMQVLGSNNGCVEDVCSFDSISSKLFILGYYRGEGTKSNAGFISIDEVAAMVLNKLATILSGVNIVTSVNVVDDRLNVTSKKLSASCFGDPSAVGLTIIDGDNGGSNVSDFSICDGCVESTDGSNPAPLFYTPQIFDKDSVKSILEKLK